MNISYSSNEQPFDLLPQKIEGFCVRGLFAWLFQKVKVSRVSFFTEVSQHTPGVPEPFHSS